MIRIVHFVDQFVLFIQSCKLPTKFVFCFRSTSLQRSLWRLTLGHTGLLRWAYLYYYGGNQAGEDSGTRWPQVITARLHPHESSGLFTTTQRWRGHVITVHPRMLTLREWGQLLPGHVYILQKGCTVPVAKGLDRGIFSNLLCTDAVLFLLTMVNRVLIRPGGGNMEITQCKLNCT